MRTTPPRKRHAFRRRSEAAILIQRRYGRARAHGFIAASRSSGCPAEKQFLSAFALKVVHCAPWSLIQDSDARVNAPTRGSRFDAMLMPSARSRASSRFPASSITPAKSRGRLDDQNTDGECIFLRRPIEKVHNMTHAPDVGKSQQMAISTPQPKRTSRPRSERGEDRAAQNLGAPTYRDMLLTDEPRTRARPQELGPRIRPARDSFLTPVLYGTRVRWDIH